MKPTPDDIGVRLESLLARHRAPSPDRMEAAIDRVGQEIGSAEIPVSAQAVKTSGSRSSRVAAVAAVAVAASLAIAMLWPQRDAPLYRVVEGVVGQGATIRSSDGAVLALSDDSRVEMRAPLRAFSERVGLGERERQQRDEGARAREPRRTRQRARRDDAHAGLERPEVA